MKNKVMIALSLKQLIAILAEEANLETDKIEIITCGDNEYKILFNCDENTRIIVFS